MEAAKLLGDVILARLSNRHARAIQLATVGLNSSLDSETSVALRIERAAAKLSCSAWASARLDCQRLTLQQRSPRVHALMARAQFQLGQLAEAQCAVELAIAGEPNQAAHWTLYSEVLSATGVFAAALRAAREAYKLNPDLPTLKLLLAQLGATGKPLEVVATIECTIRPDERDADIWTTLGVTQSALGEVEAAKLAFREALRRDPERADARCGLGYALLREGDYANGFDLHEYRQTAGGNIRRLGVPPWRGEDLTGKHLFIWTEQGMGDMIQFARFLPLVRKLAARTTFRVPKTLIRLFESNPELGTLEWRDPGFGAADYQSLLLSLPHHLRLGLNMAASTMPLLRPESELIRYWRERLPLGPTIALTWQGNPRYGGEPWRSIPLAQLEPLVRRFDGRFRFVSLQKHFGREQLQACTFADSILDLGDQIDCQGDAYVDSLAILSLVDLFITTDTSLVHLAGSANVRTWLMLPHVCDWRWGTDPHRTLWYPNTRLYRQPFGGDWTSVICEVIGALSALET